MYAREIESNMYTVITKYPADDLILLNLSLRMVCSSRLYVG